MTAAVIRLRPGTRCPAWRCRGAALDRTYRCPACGTRYAPIPARFRDHVQAAIDHARNTARGPEPALLATFEPENARARAREVTR